jgi:hypothetical protein
MRGDSIILGFSVFILAVSVPVLTPYVNYYRMTRHFSPIKKIETLQHPVAVTGWSSNGLRLADGRIVPLAGLRSLPSDSDALTEATKRGVEVSADARVWGLVRIHHWCGNDPVREHIAKVDLADMMTFLRVGEPFDPVPQSESLISEPGGSFCEWGWRVGEFYRFQSWQSSKNLDP